MPRYELRVAVRHDCPFCDISSRYPHATFRIWDNFQSIILEANGLRSEDLKLIRREPLLSGDSGAIQEGEGSIRFFIDDSRFVGPAISRLIKDNDCWYLVPDELKDGWEHLTVFSHSRENLQRLIEDIKAIGGETRISSVHELPPNTGWDPVFPVSSLLAGLTDKQTKVISKALALGHFEEPSRITVDQLAMKLGISRSTCSEHLRKAQRKILENVFSMVGPQVMERM